MLNVKTITKFFTFLFSIFLFANFCFAEVRSLKNNTVNVRLGPSKTYPVKFVYKNKYFPVIIIDEHYNWRKIIDHENDSGWIHISQLSKIRTTITTKDNMIVFSSPSIYSSPKAKLEINQVLIIKQCDEQWCEIKNSKVKGWVQKKGLWRIKKDEIIPK